MFLFLNKSISSQVKETAIATENGMQSILKANDSNTSPRSSAKVARPIPHPGQGIFVINLNRQRL